jgi:hypothetical protein
MPPPKHNHRRFYKPLPKDFNGTLCSSCAYSASQPHPEEKCIASMPAKIANARKGFSDIISKNCCENSVIASHIRSLDLTPEDVAKKVTAVYSPYDCGEKGPDGKRDYTVLTFAQLEKLSSNNPDSNAEVVRYIETTLGFKIDAAPPAAETITPTFVSDISESEVPAMRAYTEYELYLWQNQCATYIDEAQSRWNGLDPMWKLACIALASTMLVS